MEDILLPNNFLAKSHEGVLIDVRTPSEFLAGHIPGAHNLPLFSDAERVEVGTLYVQVGKDPAVEKGLEFVGPKLAGFVSQARQLSDGKPLYLYCWRGGMRSNSMAWLFRTAGIRTFVLKGGYKAYRNSFTELLRNKPWQFVVLGGPTGCGKTDILLKLRETGHQVIDLEALARNKGSAFGYLGQLPQPSTEHFANILYEEFRKFSPEKPVWCEGESMSLGRIFIPDEFYNKMRNGVFIQYETDKEFRVQNIMRDYGHYSAEELIDAFRRIEKRLGGDVMARAIKHVQNGELREAILIGLHYYDKGYHKSTQKWWQVVHPFIATSDNTEANALAVLNFYKTIIQQ